MILWCLVIILLILTVIYDKISINPEKIFGIYSQKGPFYWLKYFYVLYFFTFTKLKNGNLHVDVKETTNDIENMEFPKPMSEHPKAFVTAFFVAASYDGFKLVIGIERRKRGISHVVMYLWVPGRGLFKSPNLPDTMVFTTEDGEESIEFSGIGLNVQPVLPMNKWRITYSGTMRKDEETFMVNIDAEFVSNATLFSFQTDISPLLLADGMAKEVWSAKFFEEVRQFPQQHYKQVGFMHGKLQINDMEYNLNLQTIRQRSSGYNKDWSLQHRYASFTLFLKNGTYVFFGIYSQPSLISSIKVGFVYTHDKIYKTILGCDFELHEHGEGGTPPTDLAFLIQVSLLESYTVQIVQESCDVRYITAKWESKIIEQFVHCNMNGIPGYGIAEYHYRNYGGRPEAISAGDPEWYKKIREYERKYWNN